MQVEAGNLRPGEGVRVAFRLPGSAQDIEVSGTVVWTNETRQGIQFSKLTNQNEKAIREFISQVEEP